MAFSGPSSLFAHLGLIQWGDLGEITIYRSARGKLVAFAKTYPKLSASKDCFMKKCHWLWAAEAWKNLTSVERRMLDRLLRNSGFRYGSLAAYTATGSAPPGTFRAWFEWWRDNNPPWNIDPWKLDHEFYFEHLPQKPPPKHPFRAVYFTPRNALVISTETQTSFAVIFSDDLLPVGSYAASWTLLGPGSFVTSFTRNAEILRVDYTAPETSDLLWANISVVVTFADGGLAYGSQQYTIIPKGWRH